MAATTGSTRTYADDSLSTSFRPNMLDWIAMLLVIFGGLNWGLVGAFQFELIVFLFGGMTTLARAVYVLVGLAAVYSFSFVVRLPRDT